jgi:hypothetical protein
MLHAGDTTQRRRQRGEPTELGHLIGDLLSPPIVSVGALSVDHFVSSGERAVLAAFLNSLLVAPTFAHRRDGVSFDVGQ